MKKTGEDKEIVILSRPPAIRQGGAGRFKNVDGTKIIVFFIPKTGKLHSKAPDDRTDGNNVFVAAVREISTTRKTG